MHYWRWQNYGDPRIEPKPRVRKSASACAVEGCERDAHRIDLCNSHYLRKLKYGDPTMGGAPRDRRPLAERIASRCTVTPSGCWEWTGALDKSGYGYLSAKGLPTKSAHRLSYMLATGKTEVSMLDHKCRNRKCINPEHLREVTHSENSQNQAVLRDSRSGYRGVAWHEASQSWHVVVGHRGRVHSGGYFRDVHEAGMAATHLRNELYTHNEEDRWARP